MTKRKQAIGYIRVSTDNQAEQGFGKIEQKEQILEYAYENGYKIIDWIEDLGYSGADENRPGLQRIINDIENPPYEAVIAAATDRFARDMKLYFWVEVELTKRNKPIQLVSAKEDFGMLDRDTADFMKGFVAFAAQMERRAITRRTRGGRKIKARQGGYAGGRPPFGYRVQDGELVPDPTEAPILRKIFHLNDDLNMTYKKIAQTLNDEGHKTRGGCKFLLTSVARIIQNRKTYEGYYKYGDMDWVKGRHEPLI